MTASCCLLSAWRRRHNAVRGLGLCLGWAESKSQLGALDVNKNLIASLQLLISFHALLWSFKTTPVRSVTVFYTLDRKHDSEILTDFSESHS